MRIHHLDREREGEGEKDICVRVRRGKSWKVDYTGFSFHIFILRATSSIAGYTVWYRDIPPYEKVDREKKMKIYNK